jgi:hypothetical protein
MATVTFTGKEEGGKTYEAIPPNRYHAFVLDAEEKTSSKGDPMIQLTFEISSGEFAGRRIWNYLVLSENNMFFVRKCIEALGIEWTEGKPLDVGLNLIGKQCLIDVKIELYQGNEKNAIKFGGYHALESTKIMRGSMPF